MTVIYTQKVAHVTFIIEKTIDGYTLSSEAKGEQQTEKRYLATCDSLEEARTRLEEEIGRLETYLENKRNGMPTESQVYFLFQNKIPIPIDLTWGQAHDLIEQYLAQVALEKELKQKERFYGFEEGDIVMCRHPNKPQIRVRATGEGHARALWGRRSDQQ